jgi:hypothetical protein
MLSSVSFGGRPPVRPARRAAEDPLGDPHGLSCARIPLMRRTCELPVGLRGHRVERFGQAAEADASQPQLLDGFDQLLMECVNRSSFQTISVSPLRANSSASRYARDP